MTENAMDMQALMDRVGKVERQNRRLKLWGMLIVVILLVAGFNITSPGTITTERIRLVDKNGIVRLTMELEEGSPRIIFNYETNQPSLIISGEELSFYDHEKKPRININSKKELVSSSLSITDKAGKNSVTLGAGPEGSYLSLEDDDDKKEVILSIDPIGTLNGIESCSGKRDPNKGKPLE